MYVITGVTGNVGGAAARELLASGQSVRAVVRNPAKGQVWKDRGCEVTLATIEDRGLSQRCLSEEQKLVFILVHLQTSIPRRNFLEARRNRKGSPLGFSRSAS